MEAQALILAAGAGTRMKSAKPKVAHEILGVPLVRWVVDAARAAGIDDVVAVLGHGADQVRPLVEGDVRIVMQERQLGTGDAVSAAREAFSEDGRVRGGSLVVLSGDCPLIKPETIRALIARREETGAAVVVLTMDMPDPTGYGRIVRAAGSDGFKDKMLRIIEECRLSVSHAPREKEIYVAQFIAAGVIGVLSKWLLQEDRLPKETLIDMMDELLGKPLPAAT